MRRRGDGTRRMAACDDDNGTGPTVRFTGAAVRVDRTAAGCTGMDVRSRVAVEAEGRRGVGVAAFVERRG